MGRAVASASGALAVGMLPLFLVGALSPSIGADLGFGSAATGAAVAVFFVTGGVTAVPVGWVTERLGGPMAMRVGVTLSGLSSLAIGWLADSWVALAAALAVAGIAIGFVDTASSAWFASTVRAGRHGAAFGLKEASVPSASLLAGLSIPILASDLGWRTVFVLSTLLVPLVWVVVPTGPTPPPTIADGSATAKRWGPLVVFAAGIALGTGSATAAATFLVPGLEDRGWTSNSAGLLLAVASVASITVRLVLGWLSDRRPGILWQVVAGAMAIGAIGPVLLALDSGAAVPVAGAVLTFAAGWGWTGVAFHAVLVATRDAPALGAGIVLGGLSLGGAAGPALFGNISASASYPWAWASSAIALAAGAVLTTVARRWQLSARGVDPLSAATAPSE
jgi:predicted MFS family arabinose efflux permease